MPLAEATKMRPRAAMPRPHGMRFGIMPSVGRTVRGWAVVGQLKLAAHGPGTRIEAWGGPIQNFPAIAQYCNSGFEVGIADGPAHVEK